MDITQNNTGTFAYQADKWSILHRALIAGNDEGTFHTTAKDTKIKMSDNLRACIKEDPERVLTMAADISMNGKSPRRYSSIHALISVMKLASSPIVRSIAGSYLVRMIRSSTDMYYAASVA